MDNFKDKLKDIIYSLADYFFIIIIIVVVGGVIAWRLDLLFNKDYANEEKEIITEIQTDDKDTIKNSDHDDLKESDVVDNTGKDSIDKSSPVKDNDKDISTKTDNQNVDLVTVEIPKGAVSTAIGDILAEKGLVHDSKSFVDKATELGKETKLKSGTYEIPRDLSIEGVIEIITK